MKAQDAVLQRARSIFEMLLDFDDNVISGLARDKPVRASPPQVERLKEKIRKTRKGEDQVIDFRFFQLGFRCQRNRGRVENFFPIQLFVRVTRTPVGRGPIDDELYEYLRAAGIAAARQADEIAL